MREIFLLKCGELVLKGLNRNTFLNSLIKDVSHKLKPLGSFQVSSAQSTVYVEPLITDATVDEVVTVLSRVFGVAAICVAARCEKEMGAILALAQDYLKPALASVKTFKVESKRADKKFPLGSPEISREVGGALLAYNPHLTVDVHNPDVTVFVEVREKYAFLHAGRLPAAGGMPKNSAGKAMLLLSGGIDSPVAGYRMLRRGVELSAIHFFSYPYTSDQAKQKVLDLARKLCNYCDFLPVFVVPFTEVQLAIRDHCPEEYSTLIMRRFMVEIACRVAKKHGCMALITGESVGQVASQTLPALVTTNAVADLPIFRPLIGMDKEEIIGTARKIDTFELSTLPYEDCCTIFTPKHPRVRPTLEQVEAAEQELDRETLITAAVEGTEFVRIKNY